MIPDASLGIAANFDPDRFRNAIKFAEQMGAPNAEERKIAFVKKATSQTYFLGNEQLVIGDARLKLDRDGKPLNPSIRMVTAADELIEADCAIEVTPVNREELPVGKFLPIKAEVTMLDLDYAKVKDCRELRYNGDRYKYGYEPSDYGLFGVDVHTMVFYALDES